MKFSICQMMKVRQCPGGVVMVMSDWVSVASRRKAFSNMFRGMFKCCVVVLGMSIFMHFCCHLNHAVRKANAPEKLSDGEYISDVEEGIYTLIL